MKIFVAASFSNRINYGTKHVFDTYKEWLEDILTTIEKSGYEVYSGLRQAGYKIETEDLAVAINWDYDRLKEADVLLAILDQKVSAGVQMEIGAALAWGKPVVFAFKKGTDLAWVNTALLESGKIKKIVLPITTEKLKKCIND